MIEEEYEHTSMNMRLYRQDRALVDVSKLLPLGRHIEHAVEAAGHLGYPVLLRAVRKWMDGVGELASGSRLLSGPYLRITLFDLVDRLRITGPNPYDPRVSPLFAAEWKICRFSHPPGYGERSER